MPDAREDRIQQALRLLTDEIRERIDRHPLGHLIAGRNETLALELALPTAPRNGSIEQASRGAAEALQAALQALLGHSVILQPGRVFCLRCDSARCEHSAPPEGRQAFAGYGPTGLPRWSDFGQWLLARRDPRVDLLYREPPQLVTVQVPEAELAGQLLPAFRERPEGYRLHGEVAAGWYQDRDALGLVRPFAVSFQLVSSRARAGGRRRRFGLNVIGTGPGGEPLENLYDRTGEIPWADPVRWAQQALEGLEAQLERAPRLPAEHVESRLEGILGGLARRLDKGFRGRERRTHHAEKRRKEGDRPTGMALADLARAAREDLLVDTRTGAMIVLGERGRAHAFNADGKHVTSIRYNPAAIEKRRERGLWRPAAEGEVATLMARVKGGAGREG